MEAFAKKILSAASPMNENEWMCVPRNPTLSMENRGISVIRGTYDSELDECPRTIYNAMLAAAPTPAHVPVDPAELAELRLDAARYRWLRDEATSHLYVRKNDGGKYGVSVCTGVILDCEVDMRRKAAPHGERREAIPQPEPNNDAMWRALCGYLLKCDEPIPFLEAWTHGEWDQCAEWTDAPIECYPPEARSAKL